MKITILTGYDRNMAELAELCLPSKKAWADRHGVKLHVLRDTHHPTDFPPEHGHPSFQKLRHIRWHLERNDVVFWMDADSVITNPDLDPKVICHASMNGPWAFAVSADYKTPREEHRPPWNRWSAGHAIWSSNANAFDLLDAAMARTEFMRSGLWDQDALQAVIDRAFHPWRPTVMPTRVLNSVLPGLTGNPDFDWHPGDFLCHFTGIGRDERAEVARRFIADHLPA